MPKSRRLAALALPAILLVFAGRSAAAEPPHLQVLYDQTDSPGELRAPAWHATDGNQARDAEAADDFVVPAGLGHWTILRIDIPGAILRATPPVPQDVQALQSVNVRFYADLSGFPGTQLAADLNVPPFSDDRGTLTIDLPEALDLSPGSYWLSVQANLAIAQGDYWWWGFRSSVSNAPAVLRNPGDGLGLSCRSWSRIHSCHSGQTIVPEVDLLFRIEGTTTAAPSSDHRLALAIAAAAGVLA
jgi:hypothetical protein